MLLNTLLPNWLITFILTALLLWLTIRIGRKSITLFQVRYCHIPDQQLTFSALPVAE